MSLLRPPLICYELRRVKAIQPSQALDCLILLRQIKKSVCFRNVEYVLVIDKEEGRNFVSYIGANSSKNLTDVKHKEVVLGAYPIDMKSGVMTNEMGSFTFKLVDPKNLEIFYTKVSSRLRVASCYEMVRQ